MLYGNEFNMSLPKYSKGRVIFLGYVWCTVLNRIKKMGYIMGLHNGYLAARHLRVRDEAGSLANAEVPRGVSII